MNGSLDVSMRAITARSIRTLEHTQPWPHHFRRRSLEMRSLCRLRDMSSPRRILELGCGNAFGSALLSEGRERVVATDLAHEDMRTHSIGLHKASELLNGLGLQRCHVMAASAEALPYQDRSFDLVFSLFVLEHIPNRNACLAEIHRVLDDGGLAVHAVPGAMWALGAPGHFYLYLARRLLVHLTGRGSRRAVPPDGELRMAVAGRTPQKLWQLFRTRYPHFPLPQPHAAYRNYFEELINYSRARWIQLFERNGFEVLECLPTMVLPLGTLEAFFGAYGLALYERLFQFDQWLADRWLLRSCGQFLGIVARKRR